MQGQTAESIVEIRATENLTVFEASMIFVPGLSFLPPAPIRGQIVKQVRDIVFERRLVAFGEST